jgi:uncharacterized lipoprotein YbaY
MKKQLTIATGLACAGLLAGCGGSGMSAAGSTPPAAVDAFTQSVQAMVATASDTALPMDIDGIAATSPDRATPVGP